MGLGDEFRPRTEASRDPESKTKRYLLFLPYLADMWAPVVSPCRRLLASAKITLGARPSRKPLPLFNPL
jgi:hypothetical protein